MENEKFVEFPATVVKGRFGDACKQPPASVMAKQSAVDGPPAMKQGGESLPVLRVAFGAEGINAPRLRALDQQMRFTLMFE